MGDVFEAVRPHWPEFCNHVDPEALMCQLMTHLGRCDLVGVHLYETIFSLSSILCNLFLVLNSLLLLFAFIFLSARASIASAY